MKTVHIVIVDDSIRDVKLPEGVKLVVDDYDVPEDWDAFNVYTDDNGERYQRMEFEQA